MTTRQHDSLRYRSLFVVFCRVKEGKSDIELLKLGLGLLEEGVEELSA